jgi:hypothetical protein
MGTEDDSGGFAEEGKGALREDDIGGVPGGDWIFKFVNVAGRFLFNDPAEAGSMGVDVPDDEAEDDTEVVVTPIVDCTCPEFPTTVSGQSRIIKLTAIPPRLPIEPMRQFRRERVRREGEERTARARTSIAPDLRVAESSVKEINDSDGDDFVFES